MSRIVNTPVSLRHEQVALPDFSPTIVVDTNMGEHLSELDVDVHALNDTFLEQGMTPEQVAETTILISAQDPKAGRGMVGFGHYTAKHKRIELYPSLKIQQRIKSFEQSTGDARDFSIKNEGRYLGYTLSEILRHEMEHRIVDAQGGMPEQRLHKRRMAAESVGVFATFIAVNYVAADAMESLHPSQSLGEFAAKKLGSTILLGAAALRTVVLRGRYYYRTSPEEIRAYNAQELEIGKDWPFLTTRFKFQDEARE